MPDLSYDAIEVGSEFGPWNYPLAERIARHLEAVENGHPWHRERSPWGPPVAPPAILGNATLRFLDSIGPNPPGTLHVKQELEFVVPLRLDRRLIAYGRFADKYVRRGRKWFVFAARFRDESGLLIGHSTVTMALPEPAEEEGSRRTEADEARIGELTPVVKTVTQDKMTAYSEDSANALRGQSIHVQPEAALAAGYKECVAQGLMSADYISELMLAVFGRHWPEGGGMSLAFVKPVLAADTLTANGRLVDRADEGAFIRDMYEVWCENQDGIAVTVGAASGLVPAPGSK
ncbi:MAG: hypothetical protein HYS09_09375 [Chloroflexi bacterium]|nr:hypothetical protein [Chloroflexota bacterium]